MSGQIVLPAVQSFQYLPFSHPALWENNPAVQEWAENILAPGAGVRELASATGAGGAGNPPPYSNTGIKPRNPAGAGGSAPFAAAARRFCVIASAKAGGRPLIDWDRPGGCFERVEVHALGRGLSKLVIHPEPDQSALADGALIDTLTLSIPDGQLCKDAMGVSDDDLVRSLAGQLDELLGFTVDLSRIGKGRNFYDYSAPLAAPPGVRLSESLGFVAWGGNGGGFCVHITGAGCAYVRRETWVRVGRWIAGHGGRVTNIHLAHDDYAGAHGVDWAVANLEAGAFGSGGRPPSSSVAGDWFGGQRGRTLYIGNRKSGKMLRVYEKGRQLGDYGSEWVRWEVELRSHQRVIPLDVFEKPGQYLAGAYPPCSFVADEAIQIETIRKNESISLDVICSYAKKSYGRLVGWLAQTMDAVEIVNLLARDDAPPRRLAIPGLGSPAARIPLLLSV